MLDQKVRRAVGLSCGKPVIRGTSREADRQALWPNIAPAADDSIPPLITVGHSGASPHHIQGDAQAMPTLSTLLLALARQITNRDFRLQEALVYASVQR